MTSCKQGRSHIRPVLADHQNMLELLLLLATCTLGNMNVPIKWCGEGKLICPADVSGVGYEQCLDKDLPCGEHCHSYHNQAKGFCKETNKCYPEGGSDHIECRNKVSSLLNESD